MYTRLHEFPAYRSRHSCAAPIYAHGAQGAASHRRPAHGGVGVARRQRQRPHGSRGGSHRCRGSRRGLPRALHSRGDDFARVPQRQRPGEGSGPARSTPIFTSTFRATSPRSRQIFSRRCSISSRGPRWKSPRSPCAARPRSSPIPTPSKSSRLSTAARFTFRGRRFRSIGIRLDSPAIASTSASMPIARPRWSGSPRCRPRRLKSWSGWSSCGCSKTASRSTSPTRRATPSAWTRKKIWCAPKLLLKESVGN